MLLKPFGVNKNGTIHCSTDSACHCGDDSNFIAVLDRSFSALKFPNVNTIDKDIDESLYFTIAVEDALFEAGVQGISPVDSILETDSRDLDLGTAGRQFA